MIQPLCLDSHYDCSIHSEILVESGGTSGVLSTVGLESTLNKPPNFYHYGDDVTLYALAASYGYGMIKNHCFVDGNKRIALIAVYTFLFINEVELIASEVDAANFFLELAASLETQEEDMQKLANWLQINSELICNKK
jgi:death on curing protein